jgi:hypothetical protein
MWCIVSDAMCGNVLRRQTGCCDPTEASECVCCRRDPSLPGPGVELDLTLDPTSVRSGARGAGRWEQAAAAAHEEVRTKLAPFLEAWLK